MNPYGSCTCTLSCKPCPSCVAWNAANFCIHTGGTQHGPMPAPKARPIRRASPEAMTREGVLAIIGAWIDTHQRLPLAREWRLPHAQRPPLGVFSIYRHWPGMFEFYEACLAAGHGTRQMLREARLIGGKKLKSKTRGANVYTVIHE